MARVEISGPSKRVGDAAVLQPSDLTIADGGFVVIVGPSGCSKSTLLRLIAGLEEPSTGRIAIGGRDVTDAAPGRRLVPSARIGRDAGRRHREQCRSDLPAEIHPRLFADLDGRPRPAQLQSALAERHAPLRARVAEDNPSVVDPRYFRSKQLWQHDVQLRYRVSDSFDFYGGVNDLVDQKPDIGFETDVPISSVGRFLYAGACVELARCARFAPRTPSNRPNLDWSQDFLATS